MLRAWAVAGLISLGGCQTLAPAGAEGALSGQELDAAVGLYGPWTEYLVLDGKRTYLWRKRYAGGPQDYYCELRVEMGFRRTISRSFIQGYPQACRLFAARGRQQN
ncbi:hypothetical protein [Phenylobacterium sp.]|uniref:hypothetical protein n=1 Tax=Phenylobacterium sp. TaxID=1871053 RepID=UPI0035B4BFDA